MEYNALYDTDVWVPGDDSVKVLLYALLPEAMYKSSWKRESRFFILSEYSPILAKLNKIAITINVQIRISITNARGKGAFSALCSATRPVANALFIFLATVISAEESVFSTA